jgi:signal transduction histidine kinase
MAAVPSRTGILIVDDDPAGVAALQEALRPLGTEVSVAATGDEALQRSREHDFAAILIDLDEPALDGIVTATRIRGERRARHTPIIFLTAARESLSAMHGYQPGAVDYLVKPVMPEIVRSKLSVFVGLHDMNRMLNAELSERALTEQRLRTSEENLRALAAHLQSVREEERILIAREIHDELGQALTGLKFDIASFARGCGVDDAKTITEKTQAMSLAIDRLVNSVRRIASGLRPEVLDEIGLGAALEWQAREFQRRTGIRCIVELPAQFADPDSERSTAVFRIFQELLTNVARHANATRVEVRLQDGRQGLRLTISDNGRGIQPAEFESPTSLGFLGLRERVLAFSGTIDVKGVEGRGTTVSVTIPIAVQQPELQA